MRKIILKDYEPEEGHTFSVRSSLVAVLFNEDGLDGREIIHRDELAKRIESTNEEHILLEETDYQKVIRGLNATDLKPHGRSVVEFLKRVLDAPTIDVQEKQ